MCIWAYRALRSSCSRLFKHPKPTQSMKCHCEVRCVFDLVKKPDAQAEHLNEIRSDYANTANFIGVSERSSVCSLPRSQSALKSGHINESSPSNWTLMQLHRYREGTSFIGYPLACQLLAILCRSQTLLKSFAFSPKVPSHPPSIAQGCCLWQGGHSLNKQCPRLGQDDLAAANGWIFFDNCLFLLPQVCKCELTQRQRIASLAASGQPPTSEAMPLLFYVIVCTLIYKPLRT